MDTIQNRVGQVKAESDKLGRFLESLSGQDWEQPSACEEWTVADVVAHLIGGAEMFTEHISRGLRGDKEPPDGFPDAGEADPKVLGNLNAMRTVFRRAGLGDRLLPTFKATGNQMNQLFAGIRPGDWDQLCYHPAAEFPVRTFLSLRMFELALHGWDITSRLQPEPTSLPSTFPSIITIIGATIISSPTPA